MTEEICSKISSLANSGEKFVFIVDFDGNAEVYDLEEAEKARIYFKFNYTDNIRKADLKSTDCGSPLLVYPIDYTSYLGYFNKAMVALKNGDTYLINLTFRTEIKTTYTLWEIYNRSNAPYKLLYKDKFVVFSPERFIKISNGIIETNPMKGTIDASTPNAENKLINNLKETYEHNTIVDLLRNDLNMVASEVIVDKFRYLDKIKTNRGELLQVSSKITGKLHHNYKSRLGQIVSVLLPAGSVTGAPKERTVNLIKNIESYQRGYYTGVFGFFDGETLDVAVSIRFIEKEKNKLFYKSGGGITFLSNPKNEYSEMLDKIYLPF